MAGAYTNLVLGAYHAVALYTTKLTFLNHKFFVAVVELGAKCGDHHLLSGCHIGGATNNLLYLALSKVNGTYMHVVTVRVCFAGKYLAYYNSGETAFD